MHPLRQVNEPLEYLLKSFILFSFLVIYMTDTEDTVLCREVGLVWKVTYPFLDKTT